MGGRKKKNDFNPSSRVDPRDHPKEANDLSLSSSKACYPVQKMTLQRIAEEARDRMKEDLAWKEEKYKEIMKWILLIGIFLGSLLGIIIGGIVL